MKRKSENTRVGRHMRGRGKTAVKKGPRKCISSREHRSNSRHIIHQASAIQIMKTKKLWSCIHVHLMHGSLINEYTMSLSLISLVVLFRRLSGMEKCIVIRIVDKYSLTTIVSDKCQAKRQDTKSIDKRSWDLIKHYFMVKTLYGQGSTPSYFQTPKWYRLRQKWQLSSVNTFFIILSSSAP